MVIRVEIGIRVGLGIIIHVNERDEERGEWQKERGRRGGETGEEEEGKGKRERSKE